MPFDSLMLILAAVVFFAFLFTLTNGLHDSSSVVATFISCGAATPIHAVLLVALFGLAGALLSGTAVANTIASIGSVPADIYILPSILAALLGAVLWNVVTWRLGLPSSSTHALVGGLVGAFWAAYGPDHILWGWRELTTPPYHLTGFIKVVVSLFFSPLFGFAAGYMLQKTAMLLLKRAHFTVNKRINQLQWPMAALLAFSHGGNDTQKTVGLITVVLVATGVISGHEPPLWVSGIAGLLMFAGTLFGGWQIMRTVGRGIYTIRPLHSLDSQIAAGSSVALSTWLRAPVSTTHVVVGSIVGVGTAEEYRMVNWPMGKEIIVSWLITIPAAALSAALLYLPLYLIVR